MQKHTLLANARRRVGLAALGADAVTLRWAGRGDMQTTDPHSAERRSTNSINGWVRILVNRDKQWALHPRRRIVDASQPTTWRFKLRPGVKFTTARRSCRRRGVQL
jgi:peptide/nickel transport system substrate-binding protein